jgi:hypothetical protein
MGLDLNEEATPACKGKLAKEYRKQGGGRDPDSDDPGAAAAYVPVGPGPAALLYKRK